MNLAHGLTWAVCAYHLLLCRASPVQASQCERQQPAPTRAPCTVHVPCTLYRVRCPPTPCSMLLDGRDDGHRSSAPVSVCVCVSARLPCAPSACSLRRAVAGGTKTVECETSLRGSTLACTVPALACLVAAANSGAHAGQHPTVATHAPSTLEEQPAAQSLQSPVPFCFGQRVRRAQ